MEQRQVLANCGHDADPLLRIAEAGVDVHAADEQPPHGLLERDLESLVPFLGRGHLRGPRRERVSGRGQHRRTILRRRVDHQAPGLDQRLTDFSNRSADPGVGLDLGAEELGHHLVRSPVPLAGVVDGRVGIGNQVSSLGIDEKELLFDAECDFQVLAHGVRFGSMTTGSGRRNVGVVQ